MSGGYLGGALLGGAPVVLVADDEAMVRRAACRVLQRAGFHTLPARCGTSALSLAAAHPIAAAVLDYQMPGKNGGEVLLALRKLDPAPVVVMMSGAMNAETRRKMLEGGAHACFDKPVNFRDLAQLLLRALERVALSAGDPRSRPGG